MTYSSASGVTNSRSSPVSSCVSSGYITLRTLKFRGSVCKEYRLHLWSYSLVDILPIFRRELIASRSVVKYLYPKHGVRKFLRNAGSFLIIKSTRCTNFSNLFFGIKLYMFQTVLCQSSGRNWFAVSKPVPS